MIEDSVPWKQDLAKDAHKMEAWLDRYKKGKQEYLSNAAYYRLERFCFLIPFIVRKLMEAEKMSQEFESTNWNLRVYEKKNENYRHFDILSRGRIDRRYVLDEHTVQKIGVRKICNMLIHSTDMVLGVDEER